MGFGLALVYLAAGGNLAPCIVGHFIITAAIEPGLILAAVTGEWDRAAPSKNHVVPRGTA